MSILNKTNKVKENNNYELNKKVDNFLKWYHEYGTVKLHTSFDRDCRVTELRNLIEKVAV